MYLNTKRQYPYCMKSELAIIIPAKNEEGFIGNTLRSISEQDYPDIRDIKIFVADAKSTDRTCEIAEGFKNILNIEIIEGGPVAVARNNGAKKAQSEFVLFLDADITLGSRDAIRRSISLAKAKRLDCVGAYVKCKDGTILDSLLYSINNVVQFFSQYISPFATGMFMLFRKEAFDELGGFDTKTLFGEDYILSSRVPKKRFAMTGFIYTTNRRFKKTGYLTMISMMFKSVIHFRNKDYIRSKDYSNYWEK